MSAGGNIDALIAGYRRFRQGDWPARRALYERLAEQGQKPRALVIACSDSRADPATILDAGPGELFIIRNVANLVPPFSPDGALHGTSAALEFAVTALEVPDIIVMGHAMCGGIGLLLRGPTDQPTDFLGPWMATALAARDRVLACHPADPQEACERESVRLSLDNLRTFPWIAARLADGRVRLHGMRFGIASGVLEILRDDGTFTPA